MQFPRIHLNGSSAESLLEQYRRAVVAVANACTVVGDIDVNGRDYYVINSGAFTIARHEHIERRRKLKALYDELAEVYHDIERQHDERTASKRADWDIAGIRNLGNQPDDI